MWEELLKLPCFFKMRNPLKNFGVYEIKFRGTKVFDLAKPQISIPLIQHKPKSFISFKFLNFSIKIIEFSFRVIGFASGNIWGEVQKVRKRGLSIYKHDSDSKISLMTTFCFSVSAFCSFIMWVGILYLLPFILLLIIYAPTDLL